MILILKMLKESPMLVMRGLDPVQWARRCYRKIKNAGLEDIKVFHIAIHELPTECDVVVTHKSLIDRAKEKQPDAYYVEITDYLGAPEYQELIDKIVADREQKN